MSKFLLHLHPPRVTRRALHPLTTLGFGFLALVLFLVLGVTGILLMLYYVPTTRGALPSTQDIQYAVTYGDMVRALHRYAAHAMVFVVFCHLLRVFFTAAYHKRALNWTIGIVLFGCTLGLAFTGYLLPGDQLSYWAVVVSTNLLDHLPGLGPLLKRLLLGGAEMGDPALIRFYTLHVALLPSLMGGLIILHLWRIRKDGGLALDPRQKPLEETVPAHPHLTFREGAIALSMLAALMLLAAVVSAPLGGAPDMHQPSNPEKTPWYFLSLQEMVSYSAMVGGFVVPLLLLLLLILLPHLDRDAEHVGAWFGSGKERRIALVTLIVAAALFIGLEWLFLRPDTATRLVTAPVWVRDLVNPATGMLVVATAAAAISKRVVGTTRAAVLSGGVALAVGIVGFTIIGWCRGPGWVFYWPWEEWPHV
jgi:quinol-cytochrome oxidoreductase complex cytochrome b subunit